MFMEWLIEEGAGYAEYVGFINCFYEKSGKIQELITDLGYQAGILGYSITEH